MEILEKQRKYFSTGATKSVAFRKKALTALYNSIKKHEGEILEALRLDLGKSNFESYMCEVGLTLSEITYMKRHLKSFAKPKTVYTPISQFPSVSRIYKEPYGNVLIMSPWNYPFLLTMEPLADAIAAGNTAILKPGAYSPNVANVIKKVVSDCFPEEYVAVLLGGREANSALLEEKFDYIFFTGGTKVGRLVMEKAAAHFTPVTLEMGGKSPCIVDKSADLSVSAKRIAFGKFLNLGQTCVAPDYILVDENVKVKFMGHLLREIVKMYTSSPLENPDYGKIINEKHFDRLLSLIDERKVVLGGKSNRDNLKIEPTVMDNVTFDDNVMSEEIFGPILPVITYKTLDEAVDKINSLPHPLALYHFSKDGKAINFVRERVSFGGGCVNDVVIHLATAHLPFGGVGNSGMGAYHGKRGFDTFTHEKSVLHKSFLIDLPFRYQKYNKINEFFIRMFLK
jgi:aldehyde dehydrogenase (NAD+)